jgi:hypothetical protein
MALYLSTNATMRTHSLLKADVTLRCQGARPFCTRINQE